MPEDEAPVTIDAPTARRILWYLQGLTDGGPMASYSEDGFFEPPIEPIPEVEDLVDRLYEALRPPFGPGDRVRHIPSGDEGVVVHMALFEFGWEIYLDTGDERAGLVDGKDLRPA